MSRVHRHWGKSNKDLIEMLALASYLMGHVPSSARVLREREHEALKGLPSAAMYVRRLGYWKNAQDEARKRFEELKKENLSREEARKRLRQLVEQVADEPEDLGNVGGRRKPKVKKMVTLTLEPHQLAHIRAQPNTSEYVRNLIEEDIKRAALPAKAPERES